MMTSICNRFSLCAASVGVGTGALITGAVSYAFSCLNFVCNKVDEIDLFNNAKICLSATKNFSANNSLPIDQEQICDAAEEFLNNTRSQVESLSQYTDLEIIEKSELFTRIGCDISKLVTYTSFVAAAVSAVASTWLLYRACCSCGKRKIA